MTEHHRSSAGQPHGTASGNVHRMTPNYPDLECYTLRPAHRRMRIFGICSVTWTALIGALCLYLGVHEMALWMAGVVAFWIYLLVMEDSFTDGFKHAQTKAAERAAEAAKEQATRTAEERLAWQTATAEEIADLEAAARRQQMEWEASAEAERIAREAAETPKPIRAAARASREGEGFIYVIQFGTGAIKVGQTMQPSGRLNKHRRDAAVYGVAIVDYWVSPQHANYVSSETLLIKRCRKVGTQVKDEYFLGMTFAQAVEIAGQLPFVRIASAEVTR